jgi:hypothetical protein
MCRANSHINEFSSIYLVQADGKYPDRPIEIATDVPADAGTIMVDLPKYLAPSNACKYLAPFFFIIEY